MGTSPNFALSQKFFLTSSIRTQKSSEKRAMAAEKNYMRLVSSSREQRENIGFEPLQTSSTSSNTKPFNTNKY